MCTQRELQFLDLSALKQLSISTGSRSFVVAQLDDASFISLTIRRTGITSKPLHFTVVKHNDDTLTADVIFTSYDEGRTIDFLQPFVEGILMFDTREEAETYITELKESNQ